MSTPVTDGPRVPASREVALLRSAYRVIARQGGHRLSLQDIADEAGVSKGLLLYHYKSKDNLLLQTMRWALERTADRIRERMAAADPGDALRALVDAVWIGPEQNRGFYLLYLDLVEHAARVPSFGELPELTRSIINGLYAEVLRDGAAEGRFAVDDPDDAAETMRAFIDGTFLAWLQRREWEAEHRAYRDRCEEGLLRLLGATHRTRAGGAPTASRRR